MVHLAEEAEEAERRLVILGHILLQADEAGRQRFLRQVPPPARLAFSLAGRRQLTRASAAIRDDRARAA